MLEPIHPLDRSKLLQLGNPEYENFLKEFFAWQLQQDGADLTTELLLPEPQAAEARVIAKEAGVLCGKEEILFLLKSYDVKSSWKYADGESFTPGSEIMMLSGKATEILLLERLLLNILSRLSGIATMTHNIVNSLPPEVSLAATRKTLWGWLDKKAVAQGGGLTHRLGLFDAVLVKDNHLALCVEGVTGILEKILQQARENPAALKSFWEIEVDNSQDFFTAISILKDQETKIPGVIMCDNFSAQKIREIFTHFKKEDFIAKNIFFEVSGGIRPENIQEYAVSGVDIISAGFLTHTSRPIDFSLETKV